MEVVTYILLGLSLGLNLFFYLKSKQKPETSPDPDILDVAYDLKASGVSLVKITRVDPNSILLRRPT